MGDYTKLIVNAKYRGDKEALKNAIQELSLCDSAYHCGGVVEVIEDTFRKGEYDVVLVGQTKWGKGQYEFIDWIKHFVIQGSGQGELFAIQISEDDTEPVCHYREIAS